MGGSRRRKKKSSAGGDQPCETVPPASVVPAPSTSWSGGPPPLPTPSGARKKKGKGKNKRTYLKMQATFKCTGETCGKSWSSVHAWERDEVQNCEKCGTKGGVDQFLDELCELDNYECGNTRCPLYGTDEGRWQSIHGGNEEECYGCWEMVRPSGTQIRFGRHFYFSCTNERCRLAWEDFSLTEQRTQRCSTCGSRGNIISTKRVPFKPRGAFGGGGGGSHKEENCDMCMDLQRYGKARNCLRFKKVECRVEGASSGHGIEVITAVS